MPWTASDASAHISGLTSRQATVWARVANRALAACRADGGDDCEGRAIRQANAVARRSPGKAVKSAGDGALEILAVPFGGPLAGKDTDGEFFSERTDLCLDWFPTHRPLLYDHGLDEHVDVAPVGHVDVASAYKDEAGWWVKAQLDRSSRYWRHIAQLLEEDDEALFASSGAMAHLVKRAGDGEILRWPWVELSLTTTPANLFATVQPVTAKAHYKAAGLTPPPTIDADDTRSYADLLDRLTDDVGDFTEMTQRLTQGRVKVGRAISDARRRRLGDLMARMRDSAAEIEALLADAEPAPVAGDAPVAEAEAAPVEGKAASAPDPVLAGLYAEFTQATAPYRDIWTRPAASEGDTHAIAG
jgi:hypothetical protein